MTTPTYKIILLGATEGVTPAQAQAGFAKAFHLTPEQAAPLFATTGRVLKKGLSEAQAASYTRKLATLGVASKMQPETLADAGSVDTDTDIGIGTDIGADTDTAEVPPVSPTAAATAASESPAAATSRDVPFVFTGKGVEYFKIWIVNILLSIVTLGVYSAWAKVRNKQYFYGNTYLDDVSFAYTANPVKILIGRAIALVFLLIYSVAGELSIIAGAVMGILFVVLLPWVICKSLRFNARYSSYRNVPFVFTGQVWQAAMAFLLLPIVSVFTLGVLYPYAYYKQKQFIYAQHGYGTAEFSFSAKVGSYYGVFLLTIGAYILFLLGAFALTMLTPTALSGIISAGVYLIIMAFFTVKMANVNYNAISLKAHKLRAQWDLGDYYWLVLTNTLAIIVTLGLFIPWAKVRTAHFKAKYTSAVLVGDMHEMAAAEQAKVNALGESMGDLFDIEIGF
jgi:uncharacterized membrane protein YjgN (DUF898 family)